MKYQKNLKFNENHVNLSCKYNFRVEISRKKIFEKSNLRKNSVLISSN